MAEFQRMIPFGIKQVLKFPQALATRRLLLSSARTKSAVGTVPQGWQQRIDDVTACPDNEFITRVPDAGELSGSFIKMHNGVKVCARGYYGNGILNMLIASRGVHEPQEERAFSEIIEYLPAEPVMLELGAYWAFYSLSLLQRHPAASCHLVEPCPIRIESGKINFDANGRQGNFEQAYVSDKDSWSWLHGRTISVDGFCARKKLSRLHVLHSDIQGHEYKMLTGAHSMLSRQLIDFVLVSTHSNSLHSECLSVLRSHEYDILASADMDESFSADGLIVARRKGVAGPSRIEIAHKRSA